MKFVHVVVLAIVVGIIDFCLHQVGNTLMASIFVTVAFVYSVPTIDSVYDYSVFIFQFSVICFDNIYNSGNSGGINFPPYGL